MVKIKTDDIEFWAQFVDDLSHIANKEEYLLIQNKSHLIDIVLYMNVKFDLVSIHV